MTVTDSETSQDQSDSEAAQSLPETPQSLDQREAENTDTQKPKIPKKKKMTAKDIDEEETSTEEGELLSESEEENIDNSSLEINRANQPEVTLDVEELSPYEQLRENNIKERMLLAPTMGVEFRSELSKLKPNKRKK